MDSIFRLLAGPEATRKVVTKEHTEQEGAPDSGGLEGLTRAKKGLASGGKKTKIVEGMEGYVG